MVSPGCARVTGQHGRHTLTPVAPERQQVCPPCCQKGNWQVRRQGPVPDNAVSCCQADQQPKVNTDTAGACVCLPVAPVSLRVLFTNGLFVSPVPSRCN